MNIFLPHDPWKASNIDFDNVPIRYVTVPSQFAEPELYDQLQFIWTELFKQFISFAVVDQLLKTSPKPLELASSKVWTELLD